MWFWLAESWLISGHVSSLGCFSGLSLKAGLELLQLWGTSAPVGWLGTLTSCSPPTADVFPCNSLWEWGGGADGVGGRDCVFEEKHEKSTVSMGKLSAGGRGSVKSFFCCFIAHLNWWGLLNPYVSACLLTLMCDLFMHIHLNTCDWKGEIMKSGVKKKI